jgi:hypothetical protein
MAFLPLIPTLPSPVAVCICICVTLGDRDARPVRPCRYCAPDRAVERRIHEGDA